MAGFWSEQAYTVVEAIMNQELRGDSLPWLLEHDGSNPGVRYFALLQLLDLPANDQQVLNARGMTMTQGAVPAILANQNPDGYWVKPSEGYFAKYNGTVWSITFLAQLGASGEDPRVRAGCQYVLDHHISPYGGFSMDGSNPLMIQCLQGNLAAALIDFGWLGNRQFDRAVDWLGRSITGVGISPAEVKDAPVRYYRSGNSAPGFVCSGNNHKPCAWGATKAMLALGKIPEAKRTPTIRSAISTGAQFLLGSDPALADYPTPQGTKPSRSWFQFGFPLAYVTDVLQNMEVLAMLGYASDPRLTRALELLVSKQDAHGRWMLEYTYNGKMWIDIEEKGKPSKWVTLRALRVLKAAGIWKPR
jgi:hypothetical protein